MGLLRDLGASIGIGNLSITVDCDSAVHCGEPLRGVATITGGKVTQQLRGLEVRLLHVWEEWDAEERRSYQRSEVLERKSAAFECQVEPGSSHTVSFELGIGEVATLPEHGEWHSIEVAADIASAVDVTGSKTVSLWPILHIADTLRAIVSSTGWSLHGYQPRKARDGFIRAELRPSAEHAQRFDRLILELAANQGAIEMYATADLKEGLWKSLTGGDEHNYSLTAHDIPTLVAAVHGLIQKHAQG